MLIYTEHYSLILETFTLTLIDVPCEKETSSIDKVCALALELQ